MVPGRLPRWRGGGGAGCIHQVHYVIAGQSPALWHELSEQRMPQSRTCAGLGWNNEDKGASQGQTGLGLDVQWLDESEISFLIRQTASICLETSNPGFCFWKFSNQILVFCCFCLLFCIIAKQKSNKLQNIQQIPQNKVLKTVFRFVNFFSIKVEYEGCVLRSFQLFLMKWYSIIPSFSHTLSDTVVRNVFCFILALNYQFLPSSWFLGSAFGNICD